jgi:hypothetical protein
MQRFAVYYWRPPCFGRRFRLGRTALVLPTVALLRHTNVRHCLAAYALSQGMPVVVIFGPLVQRFSAIGDVCPNRSWVLGAAYWVRAHALAIPRSAKTLDNRTQGGLTNVFRLG